MTHEYFKIRLLDEDHKRAVFHRLVELGIVGCSYNKKENSFTPTKLFKKLERNRLNAHSWYVERDTSIPSCQQKENIIIGFMNGHTEKERNDSETYFTHNSPDHIKMTLGMLYNDEFLEKYNWKEVR